MQIRDPSRIPAPRLPPMPTPATVAQPQAGAQGENLSLDDAIRTALANSEAIRVLTGNSGQTVYDPAIANTRIDQSRAAFDPALNIQNNAFRRELPSAVIDPTDPSRAIIDGPGINDYELGVGLTKRTITGATAGVDVFANPSRSNAAGLPLDPETASEVDLGITQPLLKGAGAAVNQAPILIARINTEQSFYLLKDSVQEMVRGVIEAYWALVFARTDVWARQQQVKQGLEALRRAEANHRAGLGDIADVAQARAALANFRATLITAEANVLEREDVLRNILGLPPGVPPRIIPVTPPSAELMPEDWEGIVSTAAQWRPDLIQLRLLLEADQQRLIVANNDALPQVDAVGQYRWNGLEGRMPGGGYLVSEAGRFTGWQVGVNVSLPLGLRQSRAALRETQLQIMRDRANLDEGVHNAMHILATNYRNLAQYYEQYRAYEDTRAAAQMNLDVQVKKYQTGFNTLYLNVLEAITSWGNAVSSEAQSLTQYNTELADLERQMGTILETHGIRFIEERSSGIGPMGRLCQERCYPKDSQPGPNVNQYKDTTEAAEHAFHLDDPMVSPSPGPSAPLPPAVEPLPATRSPGAILPEHVPAPAPER